MKISHYTFFLDFDEGKYLYNTLSNSMIELDDDSYAKFRAAKESGSELSNDDFDAELLSELEKRDFITANDKDEFLKYKAVIHTQREENASMHLTLAPTMDCCFHCHYCFEKYKSKKHIDEKTMDSILKYIGSIDSLRHIRLTWFGGEPLMAVDEIERFYDKFSSMWKDKSFISNIITTGYHIDDNAIRVMRKAKISSMQITLDGMKDTHNKVKHLPGGEDVFEKVLRNIELLNDSMTEMHITIRVNLTLDNCDEYVPLFRLLSERFKGRKNIYPAPAFVLDRGASGSNCGKQHLFNHRTRSEFVLKLWNDYRIFSPFLMYPRPFFEECAIRNKMAIAFDAEGYAYKCWEVIGNKEYAIGRLDDDGKLTEINRTVLYRQLYGADPIDEAKCSRCDYLPMCNGGCPIQRIENEFARGHNDCCTYYKGYLPEFMKAYLERKRMVDEYEKSNKNN